MRLGIDLDNTIISYDNLFVSLATEQKLVPSHVAKNKQTVRDYCRAAGLEDRWTELQGIAYGIRMEDAVPFDGVEEFFRRCKTAMVEWWIISHRTQRPYHGVSVDLHVTARQWLLKRKFISQEQMDRVKLEVSRERKLQSIEQTDCDTFIDDLPELLSDPAFPKNVRRILFDPNDQNADRAEYERVRSWSQIAELLEI